MSPQDDQKPHLFRTVLSAACRRARKMPLTAPQRRTSASLGQGIKNKCLCSMVRFRRQFSGRIIWALALADECVFFARDATPLSSCYQCPFGARCPFPTAEKIPHFIRDAPSFSAVKTQRFTRRKNVRKSQMAVVAVYHYGQ